jgi:hypothetical protein
VLVEGYPDSEEEHEASATQNGNHDVELNAQDMDLGSDDDGDSDIHSIDALEEKWNELEVRRFMFFPQILTRHVGNGRYPCCRCT